MGSKEVDGAGRSGDGGVEAIRSYRSESADPLRLLGQPSTFREGAVDGHEPQVGDAVDGGEVRNQRGVGSALSMARRCSEIL